MSMSKIQTGLLISYKGIPPEYYYKIHIPVARFGQSCECILLRSDEIQVIRNLRTFMRQSEYNFLSEQNDQNYTRRGSSSEIQIFIFIFERQYYAKLELKYLYPKVVEGYSREPRFYQNSRLQSKHIDHTGKQTHKSNIFFFAYVSTLYDTFYTFSIIYSKRKFIGEEVLN